MSRLQVTYRGCVNAWECDQWGHQNVQFYLAKAADAQAALGCALGLAPSRLRRSGAALLPASERILFKRELRAGDAVCIRSGARAAEGAELRYFSLMTNEETGKQSAVFETTARLTELETGRALDLPEAACAAARNAAAAHPLPEAIAHPRVLAGAPQGAVLTYRGALETWEAGETGFVPARFALTAENQDGERSAQGWALAELPARK